MLNSLFGLILHGCWHEYSRWTDEDPNKKKGNWDNDILSTLLYIEPYLQTRSCRKCGRKQSRAI